MQLQPLRDWRPLLDQGARDRVLRAVQEIAGSIRSEHPPSAVKSTFGEGAAGLAVLFSTLARALGVDRYAAQATRYQEAALEALSAESLPPGLVDGFAGICAVDAYLAVDRGDASHRHIESTLAKNLDSITRDIGLELARGLVGCGVYALERLPAPGSRRCVRRTIDILQESAASDADGIYWLQFPPHECGDWRRDYPGGYVHFGLTHGLAGLLAFLARCVAAKADERAGSMLRGAVEWTLARRGRHGAGFSFPTLMSARGDFKPGWIYGDVAVASSLMIAADVLAEPSWREDAVEIACSVPLGGTAVAAISSHALCHGAAGLAHVYNRMAQRADRAELAERAGWWLERCFQMRRAGHGTAGFLAATDPVGGEGAGPHGANRPGNPGLWLGAAGTALALLAFVSDDPPTWDRLLLFSI